MYIGWGLGLELMGNKRIKSSGANSEGGGQRHQVTQSNHYHIFSQKGMVVSTQNNNGILSQ